MSELLKYKGYHGSVEYGLESKMLFGKVQFISQDIKYTGKTVNELIGAFEQAVDGYLQMCADTGVEPLVPASGMFNVRIDKALHRQIQIYAMEKGVTMNAAVERLLAQAIKTNA
ncbi:hypothetical protein B0181_04780 [Moraxella caviae]|uniref:Uncharacterized protein encoded in hypervariable junctions of pilus gene clusters n=1 Tax=Moraxella caviae TaxID=34060 RepID=A0A1T0A372_9GAMM|nr:type II toxin-antitoxin system HicB family antitoxin [Moraxella caviae]OOR90193.1 hypothetical protein B0181_04780 [Moraxella caviae]STZ14589.1 Uncharacterized protein encoded in hypervariable junctions of pilus gene clusters [Moraxella caviae]VEW11358.1 Uncharacterized protein encoded in hypervariable junctions of pilus gene clusters [Moraxella caviae]